MKIEIIILSWFGTMFGRHNKIQQLYFFMKMGPLCARGRVTAAFWLVILSSGLPFSSSLSTYIHTRILVSSSTFYAYFPYQYLQMIDSYIGLKTEKRYKFINKPQMDFFVSKVWSWMWQVKILHILITPFFHF